MKKIWVNWQLKVLLPVAGALVVCVLVFAMVILDFRADERFEMNLER